MLVLSLSRKKFPYYDNQSIKTHTKYLVKKVSVQSGSGDSLNKAAFRRGNATPRSDDEAEYDPVSQAHNQPV